MKGREEGESWRENNHHFLLPDLRSRDLRRGSVAGTQTPAVSPRPDNFLEFKCF